MSFLFRLQKPTHVCQARVLLLKNNLCEQMGYRAAEKNWVNGSLVLQTQEVTEPLFLGPSRYLECVGPHLKKSDGQLQSILEWAIKIKRSEIPIMENRHHHLFPNSRWNLRWVCVTGYTKGQFCSKSVKCRPLNTSDVESHSGWYNNGISAFPVTHSHCFCIWGKLNVHSVFVFVFSFNWKSRNQPYCQLDCDE